MSLKFSNICCTSIGKYKDNVLCDVLPMDACHLLLGRTWQFDREAVYHGRENKYSFKKDGVTYKIQSLLVEEEVEKATTNTFLMSGKEFIKDIKQMKECDM